MSGAVLIAVLLVAGLLIHGPLILHDPFLGRDDLSNVVPFESITSLSDYVAAHRDGRVLDLLPVRDLTFALDAFVHRHAHLSTFHLTNVLLWLVSAWLAFRVIERLSGRPRLAAAMAGLAALHPVLTSSVAWISARKHLIAAAFVLAAFERVLALRGRKTIPPAALASVGAFYALSVLSQPILLPWPLWLLAYLHVHRREYPRRAWRLVAVCMVPALVLGVANLAYYAGAYPALTGHEKLATHYNPHLHLFALGRYVFNLAAPFRVAAVYYTGSLMALAGLLALPVGALLLTRALGAADGLLWLLLILLGPMFMNLRETNIFVSDTYAASSVYWLAAAVAPAVAAALSRIRARKARKAVPLAAIGCGALALVLGWQSRLVAAAHVSDRALFERAYWLDPSPESLAHYIDLTLLADQRYPEAVAQSLRLNEWDQANLFGPYLLAKSAWLSRGLPADARLRLIEKHARPDPWSDYFAARIHAESGSFKKAFELDLRALRSESAFFGQRPAVERDAKLDCQRAKIDRCTEILNEIVARPIR